MLICPCSTTTTTNQSNRVRSPISVHATPAATAGTDYDAIDSTTHTLTFLPGEREKVVTVTVHDDLVDELDEKFRFVLTFPANTDGGTPVAIGTILDDDAAPVASIVSTVSVTEGNSGTVNVTLPLTLIGSTS